VKIFLYFAGKPKNANANAIAAEYLKRISHYATIQSCEIHPERFDPFSRHPAAQKVFLDPAGRQMNSGTFASMISKCEMNGKEMVFLVGGADGLPKGWSDRADLLLSISSMTYPHELARAVLAEQIYRAFTILRGHPYPR